MLTDLDIDSAIEAGDWRRAEQLLPKMLGTADHRDYAIATYELKSTDRNLMLQERTEAERELERVREGHASDFRRAPMSPELYE